MATKKAGGSAKNLRDSNPQYLGVKLYDGQMAQAGAIIVRQRGTKFIAGSNVIVGKDHTLQAKIAGRVKFTDRRKTRWNGQTRTAKSVAIIP